MATVTLYDDEVDENQLPQVCMRCGAPADLQKRKRFAWRPDWVFYLILVGVLPWLIVHLVLSKYMTVYVPLCNQHKNHWLIRTMIALGGLAVVLGSLAVGIVLLKWAGNELLGAFVCIGALFGLIFIFEILRSSSIRPSEITDRRITLTGVAEEFRAALRKRGNKEADVPADYGERPKRAKSEGFYHREDRGSRREPENDDN
jgi:hypothetical protein